MEYLIREHRAVYYFIRGITCNMIVNIIATDKAYIQYRFHLKR